MRLIVGLILGLVLAMPAAAQNIQKGLEAYNRGDFATALREWQPLAEQGHAAAQYNLGRMYDIGQGVPQDDAEALKWYRKAVEQGHAAAQTDLGLMYGEGRGVSQESVPDPKETLTVTQEARPCASPRYSALGLSGLCTFPQSTAAISLANILGFFQG